MAKLAEKREAEQAEAKKDAVKVAAEQAGQEAGRVEIAEEEEEEGEEQSSEDEDEDEDEEGEEAEMPSYEALVGKVEDLKVKLETVERERDMWKNKWKDLDDWAWI